MTGITRKAREATVTVKIHDSPATLDLLRRLADADMAAGTPGTLVADGEWETRAWIAKSEPQSITPTMVETQLTIVLADGVWRRGTTEHHDPRADKAGGDLDYPYDYPHDYAGMSILDTVTNATGMPQPVKLTIFGPCVNPYIIIGTNRYEVDATIPAGSRLEIDAASDSRTVTMISDTGLRTNLFGKAVRGTGRGSGTYIFEPLPPGMSTISWAGGFKFDLTAIEERSEPPWT
nr:MAG TPA: tail protein [Caudoviricetes sp.]